MVSCHMIRYKYYLVLLNNTLENIALGLIVKYKYYLVLLNTIIKRNKREFQWKI